MKYYIQYVKDGTAHLDSFYSEKARDTFERDFHRENQLDSDNYVDLIFQGEVTFTGNDFETNEEKLEANIGSQPEKSSDRKIKVGDRVRVLEDEKWILKAGEIGIVTFIHGDDEYITIQYENPSCGQGQWNIKLTNVELISE